MDKCDCCGCEMKYKRLGKPLYACEDCREKAVHELGRTTSYVQISIAK